MAIDVTSSAENEPERAKSRSKAVRIRNLIVALLLIAAGVILAVWIRIPDVDGLLSKGEAAYAKGHYPAARVLADRVLAYDPESQRALVLKGRSIVKMGSDAEAFDLLNRVVDDGSATAVAARCAAGDLYLLQRRQLSAAEEQYRKAIEQDPDNPIAHKQLSYTLALSSRIWESTPHRLTLIRDGAISIHQLYSLSLGERVLENPKTILEYYRAHPEDLNARVGRARLDMEVGRHEDAIDLLQQVVEQNPRFSEAQVRLGKALEQKRANVAVSRWSKQVPESAKTHPGIWFVWGTALQRMGKLRAATRCFWEVIKRDPSNAQAQYQLGRVLQALNRSDDAVPFLKRAGQLEAYVKSAELTFNTREPVGFRRTVELAEQCGLPFEAIGWAEVSLQEAPDNEKWAQSTIQRLRPQLHKIPLTRTLASANPAMAIDLSNFPLPRWEGGTKSSSDDSHLVPPRASVRFENEAADTGLAFQYFNAGEPTTKGLIKMYEVVGGGAAVIDYDVDGWPDVHFAQGCPWPVDDKQREFIDPLYRNSGDGRFENVTAAARIIESGFSHGASVGDYNSDGFPDLFVNNIGQNRLFENNGDGTFTDVTERAGIAGNRYTVSSVTADFNRDGFPDIYAVNYLSGDDLFTRICGDDKGYQGSCLPHSFSAAQDQLYLNRGNGEFENVTMATGILAEGGKGLGVIAADFEGTGILSLFVANDVAPNFFFKNQTGQSGDLPRFSELGLVSGVALNFSGQHESSMGIAAGDSNSDGLIDLFVTNFDDETNTLYQQTANGLFKDVTIQAGFGRKLRPTLGWGTQFLDGDLDGKLDLLVTNGHVNKVPTKQIPFQMHPQFFQNVGAGEFLESSPRSLGSFFEHKYLGRGLARLDWNRDGRDDAVISHLDASAALLTNTTQGAGHWLAVRLVARKSARDAIGTSVTVTFDEQRLTRQLTAGDGNQASNERKLVFGLGDSQAIDRLEVNWPSGTKEIFTMLESETELMLVEGLGRPLVLQNTAVPSNDSNGR